MESKKKGDTPKCMFLFCTITSSTQCCSYINTFTETIIESIGVIINDRLLTM